MEIYSDLKERFKDIIKKYGLEEDKIVIKTNELTAEEAIGITERKDYPLLNGREVLVEADYKGSKGQAYTDGPTAYSGTISDIMELDISDNRNKVLFIASLNAVLKHLELIEGTIHCKDEEPEICAARINEHIKEKYGKVKIVLVGLQPAMLDHLKDDFEIRVLDLDKNIVGKDKYGVLIEHGIENMEEVLDWADLYLVTGSTITNGSIINYIDKNKPVLFFGTTIAGPAYFNNYERVCFCSK